MASGEPARAAAPAGGVRGEGAARFWREIYWFTVIGIAGAAVALWVLPARATRHQELLELEAELRAKHASLEREKQVLEAAIHSVDHDEFYREAVWRKVLGVKKTSEEFLEPRLADGR
jgi:hypothetical protein